MRHWKTVLAALVMLAAACGGDTATTETTASEVAIERPTVNTETPPTTASQEETETVVSEPEGTATQPVECPEGTVAVEGGCLHVPDETPSGEDVTTEDADAQGECETSGGVWDADTSTCAQTEMEETPEGESDGDEVPEPLGEVVEEPVSTEEPTETETPSTEEVEEPVSTEEPTETETPSTEDVPTVSAYGQDGPRIAEIPTLLTHSPEEVIWWYPNLMSDGFNLIDPDSAGATSWEFYSMAHKRLTPLHDYYVFYHGDGQFALQNAWKRAASEEFWRHQWLYYPVRYDVSRQSQVVV